MKLNYVLGFGPRFFGSKSLPVNFSNRLTKSSGGISSS
jgi:hypothetical protein